MYKSILMSYVRFVLLLSIFSNIACKPQEVLPAPQWHKGNLHTHSYWSDGDEFPEVIMDWYKSHDYQFIVLSDHNTLAEGDTWKMISHFPIYQKAFKNYLETYGADWVNYKVDSLDRIRVKLKTLEEYRGLFEESGKFLIMQSEEISDSYDDKPLHMNATNIQERIEPQGGNSVVEVLQNNIDAVLRQRDSLNIPMMVHVNHPNFGFAISLEDMISLRDERFFEVYNGHYSVHNSGDSIRMSTESMWDHINIAYLENNKPLILGIATDDAHHYHIEGKQSANAGRGWVMVQSNSLDPQSLIDAMEAGDFYASTGVILKELSIGNKSLSVEVKHEEGINYQISFIGCKRGRTGPEEFLSVEASKASFEITDDILFVRCKIVSSKLHANPIEDLIYESAWTQPVVSK